ncbi:uncharacterized protein EI90DRAFT_2965381 [Cantharellus anzutake]|uniref:uncharacterized protein n=1 Tax=Cantharellus anzutake TaxID=1750568 RepID=UPI00190703DE|nr:uncharacterized protein EI90DRAFT_2965381 [Cantharellus anzutake]KAF8342282.1 hypothetical protein EI90DRAFT_2965381 [Cantharellus anzutake]
MSLPPNPTLYVHNLDDKVKKDELRRQLYALFNTYGKIIDVVAEKGTRKRGQAFVVFRDIASATSAMRSLDGELFYGKKMRIEYAKTSSYATLRANDSNWIPPKLVQSSVAKKAVANGTGKFTVSNAENDQRKRLREGEDADMNEPDEKKRRDADDDMEMDEDDDQNPTKARVPPSTSAAPSPFLYCQNLPVEVTEDVLAVLFQQYPGFLGTKLSAADPTTKSKTGHVRYATTDEATVALEALNGFQVKRGWKMGVSYALA